MRGRLIVLGIEKTSKGFKTRHGIETSEGIFSLNFPDIETRFDLPLGSQVDVAGEKKGQRIDVYSMHRVNSKTSAPLYTGRFIPVI